MPLYYDIRIKNNSILANVNSTKTKVKEGMFKGMHMGADELRDFTKNELLSGQRVQKRSGQLRNALYVKRSGDRLTIFFRGMHTSGGDDISNKELAEILEKGLFKSWWQPKRNRWHRGIKAHYFMQEGLIRKKERILQLVKSQVNIAVRTK